MDYPDERLLSRCVDATVAAQAGLIGSMQQLFRDDYVYAYARHGLQMAESAFPMILGSKSVSKIDCLGEDTTRLRRANNKCASHGVGVC